MSTVVSAAATPAVTHRRRNSGVLADVEKRTLIWIAERLPAWVHSDHLTALGLFGMVGVGAAFAVGGTHSWALPLVVLALAVNWFGDSLDGTLSRGSGTSSGRATATTWITCWTSPGPRACSAAWSWAATCRWPSRPWPWPVTWP